MATASFKSTSRRGAATEPKAPPPAAASRRRSHSVSAVSRKIHAPFDDNTPISTQFSNSRDNPLFWSRSSSPPDQEETAKFGEIAASSNKLTSSIAKSPKNGNVGGNNSSGEQRGRSVTRSLSHSNGIGRSLSRVRGRSVSTSSRNGAYESEKEQSRVTSPIAQSRNETKRSSISVSRTSSVRNRASNPGQAKHGGVRSARSRAKEWSEDDSAISNVEDGISVGSLSEAEEKTIGTAFEELNVFRRNNPNQAAPTNVPDMPSDLVNPEAVELISDIRREYAIKLEESEERARKLRADLAIEEHRGQELDRILKEMLSDRKTSDMQRSRRGRKTSNERKRMSNRLTEEAMAYFDELSLSTFDSSDFSAPEDPTYSLIGAAGPVATTSLANGNVSTLRCYDQGSIVDHKQTYGDQVQPKPCTDSEPTTKSSNDGPGSSQLYEFSFADKRLKPVRPQEDIRSYIKNFEREANKDTHLEVSNSCYDAEEYNIQGKIEGLLFDRVLYSSRIESGGLLLCGGAISCLPFASTMW